LIIILVIVLLIFGARRLPEIGSAMGKAIRGFKGAVSGDDTEVQSDRSFGMNSRPAWFKRANVPEVGSRKDNTQ
jgi:sec-independent protein translocase protein TatA